MLLPATPGWVSLPVVVGGPRHSWLGSVGGVAVWLVCGVWPWCVGGVLAAVWCGWSLATPAGGTCVLLPATPGWVSLPVVVGGPRHSWLGSACGGGVWCVVCGGGVSVGLWLVRGVVGPSPLLAEVPVCYSPPLLAGFRCRWWWAVPATPGWGPLAALLCGWCVVCGRGVLVGLWLVCGVVVLSPPLAVVPVCYSPPLLAGFRCRWWWAVPATPGWGPLAAVVCGVWCVAVVCWWGCGWCVVWLVPRHSWRRFLCATPRHSWLGFAAGGGGRSPPLLAGVRLRRWCVVCVVWRWCVGGVVAGVWCGWSLASPRGGSCVLLPATPGWVSLPVVVGSPRHSRLGSAGGAGVWCVLCGVWRWCVGGVVAGVWCGWSLATPGGGSCVLLPATPGWASLQVVVGGPRHSWLGFAAAGGGRSPPLLAGVRLWPWCVVCVVWRWCVGGVVAGVWCGLSLTTPGGGSYVLLPATPGWVSLPVVVGGPRHSWLGSAGGAGVWCVVCGGGVLLGLWLMCGVVGPSPLLAEVPVCYSPPLLAGFRCRWWWAVPATPGWGPVAAVVCGVWCVGGVPRHSWRRFLCATPRHSWLGFAAAVDGRSPPLLAGVRWRQWCVVCGAWPGRAGRPPGRVLVRLTFSFGRFVFLLSLAPSGLGLPLSLSLLLSFPFGCRALPALAPRSCLLPGRPPPLLCLAVFVAPAWCLGVFFSFFFFLCAPPLSPAFSGFRPRVPWASALALFALLAFRFSALPALVPLSCFPPGCWLLPRGCCPPPPPLCVSRFSFLPLGALCRVVLCVPGCGAAPRCCALCRPVLCCRVLCCARLVPLLVAPRPLALPVALGPCALRRCVLRYSPRCVLCAVCVLSWRGGACCCSPLCLVLCVSRGAVLCVPCALRSVRCCALLCWCARVVLFVWCVLLLAPGAVVRCCVLCCFLWCAEVRCWVPWPVVVCCGVFRCRCPCLAAWSASLWLVWFAVVPCFPVSCSVVLCCRVVLCCCALLSCCGAAGACFALLWAVVLCCVVLLVGCAVFGPVVVFACCGALFLVLCVPCLLRSVRCVCVSRLAVGCSFVVSPAPLPICVSRFSSLLLGALVFFFFLLFFFFLIGRNRLRCWRWGAEYTSALDAIKSVCGCDLAWRPHAVYRPRGVLCPELTASSAASLGKVVQSPHSDVAWLEPHRYCWVPLATKVTSSDASP